MDVMEKLKCISQFFSVLLVIAVTSTSVFAGELGAITFRGGVAGPGCSFDSYSISCYNQQTNQYDSEYINQSLLSSSASVSSQLGQINALRFEKIDNNEVVISLLYN